METGTKEGNYFSRALDIFSTYRWLWVKRIGRREYFKINATNFAVLIVLFFIGAAVTLVSKSIAGLMLAPYGIWFVITFYVYIVSSQGRLNDLRMSRLWIWLLLVPIIWIFFFFYLFLKKGKQPLAENS